MWDPSLIAGFNTKSKLVHIRHTYPRTKKKAPYGEATSTPTTPSTGVAFHPDNMKATPNKVS